MERVVLTNTDSFLVFFTDFEWSRIFESAIDKQEVNVICNHIMIIFFCERLCIIDRNSTTVFKKPTISVKIVFFSKFVSKILQLVRKRSQKNNQDVVVHYNALPISHCQVCHFFIFFTLFFIFFRFCHFCNFFHKIKQIFIFFSFF